jgi:hypothetical protein
MGSIIAKFRNNKNKIICDNLIEHFTKVLQEFNIGVNIYIGKSFKLKKYRYKSENYPKYYININLPYGCNSNFNIINSGSIILNGNDSMALLAFNRFQSVSKIYRPISEFYQIENIQLANNINLIDEINYIINKIIILENK